MYELDSTLKDGWGDDWTWSFRAIVTRVVDGDTMCILADLGYSQWVSDRIRLVADVEKGKVTCGLDAPEKRGPSREEGKESMEALTELLHAHSLHPTGPPKVVIRTAKKKGKFGRMLASVHGAAGVNIGRTLIDQGYAVERNY